MKVECISDLHGEVPMLKGADVLVIAGDFTARGTSEEMYNFKAWLKRLSYKHTIVIGGNHDGFLQKHPNYFDESGIIYLCDSGVEIEGKKFWGSPYTPTFKNWYFMRNRGKNIKKHWDMIPYGLDMLITHGPPYGWLDKDMDGDHVGCKDLLETIKEKEPKHHVFGHIHEGYGRDIDDMTNCPGERTHVYNVSYLNEEYEAVNESIIVEI